MSDLKKIYAKIREKFAELPPPGTKDSMVNALHAYEESHPDQCSLVPSSEQFYGFTKGSNLLRKHIEWIYVPAVKDVTSEQLEGRGNTFGKLVARAVRSKVRFSEDFNQIREAAQSRYQELLEESASVLEDLSKSLQARVTQWAHPGARVHLKWDQDPDKSVSIPEPLVRILAGEGQFAGELARFGNGLQRSYLLALLHELSTSESSGPTLVLACEEPELYQHPPQARHLASVLMNLSEHGSQVMASTHSPLFVAGDLFEDVRVVRKDRTSGKTIVGLARFEDVARRLAQASGKPPKKRKGMTAILYRSLQPHVNDIFCANRVILVEGIEDTAYLTSYLHLLGKWDEFRRRGLHLVAANGKRELLEPLVVLLELGIPVFVAFDADGSSQNTKWQAEHERDNLALLRALGVDHPVPFPTKPLWGDDFVQWPENLSDIVQAEMGKELWQQCAQLADGEWGHAGNLRKNPLHIGTSLQLAWESGGRSPTLDRIGDHLLCDGA